jgi:hypothetical protein
VLEIDVVAETAYQSASESEWWVGVVDPGTLLRLHGDMAETEIAAIIVAIARQNQLPTADGFAGICNVLLKDDGLILFGGIRVRDDGKEIRPGCCCGVETWREQAGAFQGKEQWLGHDPAPWVEVRTSDVLLWSDGGIGGTQPDVFSISIPREQAERVLDYAQHDLKWFLGQLYNWAERVLGSVMASSLVTTSDDGWAISDS